MLKDNIQFKSNAMPSLMNPHPINLNLSTILLLKAAFSLMFVHIGF